MNTQTHLEGSPDPRILAFGREVAELLSMSSPANWRTDLWEIYSGFMIAQDELGFNPRGSNIFESFKELLFFFQKIEELK